MDSPPLMPIAESVQALKNRLAQRWPEVPFEVVRCTGAADGDVRVHWTLGPMVPSYSHVDSVVANFRSQASDPFGGRPQSLDTRFYNQTDGKMYRSGLRYVVLEPFPYESPTIPQDGREI